jgi:sugar (pentulose or hexulose) kinase
VILAVDQGTTGTTCLVVDAGLDVRGRGYRELSQQFSVQGSCRIPRGATFEPSADSAEAERPRAGWRLALRRTLLD